MAAPIALCDTEGMDRSTWLTCRMHGPKGDIPYTVGGSDVAVIFGVSPWTTPLELWMIKKGKMKPPLKANSNQLEMGHFLEPIAAHFYGVKTGNTVTEDTNMLWLTLTADLSGHQMANPVYWNAKAARITMLRNGRMENIRCITNFSLGITWRLQMSVLVTFRRSGEIIPTMIWLHLDLCVIKQKKI